MYFKKGKAKIEIAVAKGKKQYDKRQAIKDGIGIVTKQDILEKQAKTIYLAIGSNLGDKKLNIELAKYKLQNNSVKIIKSSSNYETLSWPDPTKPKFINIVIKAKTTLSPKDLLNVCNKIEIELGRKRIKKNEPRVCDIDILDYDQKIIRLNGVQS